MSEPTHRIGNQYRNDGTLYELVAFMPDGTPIMENTEVGALRRVPIGSLDHWAPIAPKPPFFETGKFYRDDSLPHVMYHILEVFENTDRPLDSRVRWQADAEVLTPDGTYCVYLNLVDFSRMVETAPPSPKFSR